MCRIELREGLIHLIIPKLMGDEWDDRTLLHASTFCGFSRASMIWFTNTVHAKDMGYCVGKCSFE